MYKGQEGLDRGIVKVTFARYFLLLDKVNFAEHVNGLVTVVALLSKLLICAVASNGHGMINSCSYHTLSNLIKVAVCICI